MADNETKKTEPSENSKQNPAQLLGEFLDKEGLSIAVVPQFEPTNHGTYEIGMTIKVSKIK